MAAGDPASAETELREVRASQARILGLDHPRTLITTCRLAASIAAQERTREARVLYRDTHDSLARVLGTDHPDTIATLNDVIALA
jgi:eukaryotic-like serine/threonine-protein kinase